MAALAWEWKLLKEKGGIISTPFFGISPEN